MPLRQKFSGREVPDIERPTCKKSWKGSAPSVSAPYRLLRCGPGKPSLRVRIVAQSRDLILYLAVFVGVGPTYHGVKCELPVAILSSFKLGGRLINGFRDAILGSWRTPSLAFRRWAERLSVAGTAPRTGRRWLTSAGLLIVARCYVGFRSYVRICAEHSGTRHVSFAPRPKHTRSGASPMFGPP